MTSDFITIHEHESVRVRAEALGCNKPDGLVILPRNFTTAAHRDELAHEDSVVVIRKLWRRAGIPASTLEREGERFGRIHEQASTWIAPTIFVVASMWTENPHLVSVALSVVGNYATDFFKGITGPNRVRTEVVVERPDGSCKRVNYDGPAEGLSDLAKVAEVVFKGD